MRNYFVTQIYDENRILSQKRRKYCRKRFSRPESRSNFQHNYSKKYPCFHRIKTFKNRGISFCETLCDSLRNIVIPNSSENALRRGTGNLSPTEILPKIKVLHRADIQSAHTEFKCFVTNVTNVRNKNNYALSITNYALIFLFGHLTMIPDTSCPRWQEIVAPTSHISSGS